MAKLLRIEPTTSHVTGLPDGKAWFVFDDGKRYHRSLERDHNRSRSNFPAPAIRRDSIDPMCGADGRMYDSLSALRRTYLPENNPKGERYFEIGNEELPSVTYDFDPKQRRDDIKAAIEDVKNGRVPPVTVLED